MTARFAHQPAQGKGPRLPKTVRPAFLLIGAAITYSQYFYAPQVRLEPVHVTAAQTVAPIRSTADERIAIAAVRGANGPVAEQRLTEFMKLLIEIGNEEIRKGQMQ
jgi:hypothetical protein